MSELPKAKLTNQTHQQLTTSWRSEDEGGSDPTQHEETEVP